MRAVLIWKELEEVAFKDLLIADREFWHFKMLEDDFDIEVWNPVTTFYHKSPKRKIPFKWKFCWPY